MILTQKSSKKIPLKISTKKKLKLNACIFEKSDFNLTLRWHVLGAIDHLKTGRNFFKLQLFFAENFEFRAESRSENNPEWILMLI